MHAREKNSFLLMIVLFMLMQQSDKHDDYFVTRTWKKETKRERDIYILS